MRKCLALLLISAAIQAQDRTDFPPLDPRAWAVVLDDPKTRDVTIDKDVEYLRDEKGILHIDVYQPAGMGKDERRPAVIFLNTIGEQQGQPLVKSWGIYSSWPRLIVAHGMVGISMETDGNRAEASLDALFLFLKDHGSRFHLDAASLGVYAASANVSKALPYLMRASAPPQIKAAVMYYGGFIPGPYRKDLPVFFLVAEGDVPRNNYRDIWTEVLRNNAPWTVTMATGLPHGFDAFEDSDDSRRMIRQTISFWKDNLERLPPRATPKSPAREILSAQYGHDDKRLITLLETWLSKNPNDAAAWFQYASSLKNERRYEDSEKAYRKVLSFEPQNVRALTYLYLLMYQLNRPGEAGPFLSAAEKIGIDKYAYAGMGYTMYTLNRHKEGVPFFEKAVAMDPTANNLYNLACGYARLGDANKALDALERSITAGYKDIRHMQEDADLESLHSDQRFQDLLKKASGGSGPTPHRRAHHALVYDAKQKNVLMANGSTPLNGGQSFRFFNDLWRTDGTQWISDGSSGDERSGNRLAFHDREQKIYSYGGYLPNGEYSAQLRVLEGKEWSVLSDHADMKATEGGLVYDAARDVLVAFGGSMGRKRWNGSTWEWDGSTWKKFQGPGPGARDAFVMVYDTHRKKTIVFGGNGDTPGGYFGDTWTYDGKAWSRVSTDGPEPRLTPGYAFDTRRGLLYLFGGIGDHRIFGDTWCWDGRSWKKVADTGPSPRAMGYMAYDAGRDRIILFGGRPQWPDDADDTWEWDGSRWQQIR